MFRSKAILGSCIAISVLTTVAALATYLGGEEFDLSWYTIDGGGEMFSTGGDFELSSTIGQPDAGVLTGGEFTLSGGFWNSVEAECPAKNGTVDLSDFGDFVNCVTGPGMNSLDAGCEAFDFECDNDVDLIDWGAFQIAFASSG